MRIRVVPAMMVLAVLLGSCGRAASDRSAGAASGHSLPRHVGASGMVVARSAAKVTFCGGPFPSVSRLPLAPPSCDGIHVVGVRLSTLSFRHAIHGAIWGDAYLAGIFRNGVLHVSEQGPPRAASAGPHLAVPPCPTPAGGWATSALVNPSGYAWRAYQRRFRSDVVSASVFRPRPRAWVLTIASVNPRRTIAMLSSAYRERLCVVRSRYQLREVRAAANAARALLRSGTYAGLPYRVTGFGMTVGIDGQPIVDVNVVAYTTAIRSALASLPAGLVRIVPWLQPVSG